MILDLETQLCSTRNPFWRFLGKQPREHQKPTAASGAPPPPGPGANRDGKFSALGPSADQ